MTVGLARSSGNSSRTDTTRASGDRISRVGSQMGIVGNEGPARARAGVSQRTLAASRYAAEQHTRFSISRRNHASSMQADEIHSVESREHQTFQKLVTKPLRPIQHGAADVQASSARPNRELRAIGGIASQRESVGRGLIGRFRRRWIALVHVNREVERWSLKKAVRRTPTLRCDTQRLDVVRFHQKWISQRIKHA